MKAAGGTTTVLDNHAPRVVKDFKRLTGGTLRSILNKMNVQQASLSKDPLSAAKRNPLGRPKSKIKRREKPRKLRQLSEQTMAFAKEARKASRTLQCVQDNDNKVGLRIRYA